MLPEGTEVYLLLLGIKVNGLRPDRGLAGRNVLLR